MCKYYGYIRVSTETQSEKGNGLDVQRNAIEKYAADNGLTVERIFCDAGISGTKESRPALDELLIETIKEGDTIIVHNTSRLWRDIFAQATIMKAVMNSKAHIRSIDDKDFDVYKYMTEPENFIISGMMGMLDQWERMTIARKLTRGRATKAHTGAKPAGICPYGYQYADNKKSVVINPAESNAVRYMYTEAQKGKSLSQIVSGLTDKGITTRQGKQWSKGSVSNVLKNKFYTGILTHAGTEIKGTHEAIISKIQFGKVQAQLEKHHK